MHDLYEVQQALEHIESAEPHSSETIDRSAVRVGLVLMALGGTAIGAMGGAYERVRAAEEKGFLQVFVDRDGVRRGHVLLAMLDDATDAEARSDPITVLSDFKRQSFGTNAWLLATFGGLGQGRAIGRHLRDNILRDHDRLTYLKRLNGRLVLRTIECNRNRGFGKRAEPAAPGPRLRFAQLRSRLDRVIRFCHYARLLHQNPSSDLDARTAFQNFTHSSALLQQRFEGDGSPTSYVSWAMLGDDTIGRIERDQTKFLRPGDWRSGVRPCIIEALGEAEATSRLLEEWRKKGLARQPLRLIAEPETREVRFADAF